MLRICTIKSPEAAKSYYTDPRALDYYTAGQEKPGVWGGKAAEMLGLHGLVNEGDFHFLCDNRAPLSGRKWTSRDVTNRRVGYDLNFHCPKSVSVLHALTGDEAICQTFERVVRDTMEQIEEDMATRVRVGSQNEDRKTGNMVWAQFTHLATRPVDDGSGSIVPDPHLHVHAVAFNGTWDTVEEKWKAGQFGNIKFDGRYYEACFYSRLVRGLQDLGYEIERRGKGWEIKGVDSDICKLFSNRTKEIELAKNGQDLTVKQEAALGQITRRNKDEAETLTALELRKRWFDRLDNIQRERIIAASSVAKNRRSRASPVTIPGAAERAAIFAVEHVFERKSVDTERGVISEAIRAGLGRTDHTSVEAAVRATSMLRYEDAGKIWCTTHEVLAEEGMFIDFCKGGRSACSPFHPDAGGVVGAGLSDQQRLAMLHVLESRDRVTAIRGRAGTGKTTMMTETVEALRNAGHQVFTFAPTSDAAKNTLRREGFRNAETVQRLLIDPNMQSQVAGHTLWIDEAGLLSSRQMAIISQLATEQNCRIILSGDTSQHSSVERGDALRILENYAELRPAELGRIYRQQDPTYCEAVQLISDGQVDQAFDKLDSIEAIKEVRHDERYHLLATDYVHSLVEIDSDRTSHTRTTLCVSPTHKEGRMVTTAIRALLRAKGQLTGESHDYDCLRSLHWTEAERGSAENYRAARSEHSNLIIQTHKRIGNLPKDFRGELVEVKDDALIVSAEDGVKRTLSLQQAAAFDVFVPDQISLMPGDLIRVTRNAQTREGGSLENGTFHRVESIEADGAIRIDDDRTIASDLKHFSHGYCVTSHASQGKTVDNVLIAQSSGSFSASSLQQFYVSASRGRRKVRIYTDDKDALREAVRNARVRRSASDYWTEPKSILQERQPGKLRTMLTAISQWANWLTPSSTGPRLKAKAEQEKPVAENPLIPKTGIHHER